MSHATMRRPGMVGLVCGLGAAIASAQGGGLVLPPGNLGVVSSQLEIQRGVLTLSRAELELLADANGDGDQSDFVPQFVRLASGASHTLPLASFVVLPQQARGPLVLAVSESGQGQDLDADGDQLDQVLALSDPHASAVQNLGLPNAGVSRSADLLLIVVPEGVLGTLDLNGDGDLLDRVLHVHALQAGLTTNLRLALPSGAYDAVVTRGRHVVFGVGEAAQGADLDGDGALDDVVVHTFDRVTGSILNTGLADRSNTPWATAAGRVLLQLAEADVGQDADGDGTLDGFALVLFDPATAALHATGLGYSAFYPLSVVADGRFVFLGLRTPQVPGGHYRLQRIDAAQPAAADLRADLGSLAEVLGTGKTPVVVDGRFGGVLVREGTSDLNADGDTTDLVAHRLELATGQLSNLGLACESGGLAQRGAVLACFVSEHDQGALDRNGDGDTLDRTLSIVDLRTGSTTHTQLAARHDACWPGRRWLTFGVPEIQHGQADLNGDGDAADLVLHVLDLRTGVLRLLGAIPTQLHQAQVRLDEPWLGFQVSEADGAGGTDLNADGDADDRVVHVVRL